MQLRQAWNVSTNKSKQLLRNVLHHAFYLKIETEMKKSSKYVIIAIHI